MQVCSLSLNDGCVSHQLDVIHFKLFVWFKRGGGGPGVAAESPGQLLSPCLAAVVLLSDADFIKVDLHNVCPLGDG